ncbi:MAG TPA: hypothetical protein VHI95_00090 [Acidimicrobiales bacterium]|nr:hypothetical protein [Acidimicrobiales bacterium]
MRRVSVEQAARNNAAWCDAVCAAHGLTASFDDRVWSCASRTPPLYPDAVTLDPTASADDVLVCVDTTTPGCSVKDSFAMLDLRTARFRVLFDATWIGRTRTNEATRASDTWSRVVDPAELERWRRASDLELRDELLDREDILILAGRRSSNANDDDNDIVAGAVLNHSDSVIGISNVFAAGGVLDSVWSACVGFTDDQFPGVPLVGYEAGAPLAAALRHGFEPLGQLRVWIDADAQSRADRNPSPIAEHLRPAKMKK